MDRALTRRGVEWVIGLLLLLGLSVALQLTLGWGALLRPWREIPLLDLMGAAFLLVASYGIRTVRIHRYFAPETNGRFLRSFRLVLVHNLFNNLLPMRTGEASFPLLMKRDFEVSFSRSVPALLYLRLLDLHFLLLVGAGVVLIPKGSWGWMVVLFLGAIPAWAYRVQARTQAEGRGIHNDAPEGNGVRVSLVARMRRLRDSVRTGLPSGSHLFWTTWLWTAANWSAKILVFAWILRVFRPMPVAVAIAGSVTGELSSVLPFHGVAGAGTYEAGVMAGLVPGGVEWEGALAAAVNLHLFVLGVSVLCGLAAYLYSGRERIL